MYEISGVLWATNIVTHRWGRLWTTSAALVAIQYLKLVTIGVAVMGDMLVTMEKNARSVKPKYKRKIFWSTNSSLEPPSEIFPDSKQNRTAFLRLKQSLKNILNKEDRAPVAVSIRDPAEERRPL